MYAPLKRRIRVLVVSLTLAGILALITIADAATISGFVTDQSGKTGLGGATVRVNQIQESKYSKITCAGEKGDFTLTDLPAGDYIITVTYVGFATQSFTVQIEAEEKLTFNVPLVPSPIDIQAISVTASRIQEKIVEAPAAVSVVGQEEIASRATLTPTEHVKGLPGADVATTGLNQSSMVVRGFNNIFSGALLVLVDNRIARVPSLRYNAYQFISITNEDIARIEIISGPGSALYGPNSANGVLHILTKSPFSSQGTTVSLGSGERKLFTSSFRHAGSYKDRIGYKITGQYYRGLDWKEHDPFEPDSIRLFRPTPHGPNFESGYIPNERDFNIEKISGEGRVDFLIGKYTSLIVNGGFNRSNSIELTGLGAVQGIGWTYWYTQARFKYKDLYVAGFVNASDAGDTYMLRSGQLIVDNSKVWAGQIQQRYRPLNQLAFIYGFDALFTRPETEATINGRNESIDNINEFGAYAQADYRFTDRFKLIGAARIDNHSALENPVWSPRAAMVYQPNQDQSFRATFNSAYQTPDNTNLFLDILQASDPFGVGAGLEPILGFSPAIDIRAQGVPETGFHWNFDDNGNPRFRSPFARLDNRGLTSDSFIDLHDPIFTNVMWQVGRGAVISDFAATLADSGLDLSQVESIITAVNNVVDTAVSGVNNTLMMFNQDIENFEPTTSADIVDINRLSPAITQTFELGYKGIINDWIRLSADLYATRKSDFIGPLAVETPNVFLDPVTLREELESDIAEAYASASPTDRAVLDSVDLESLGGNGNGTPVDELVTRFTTGTASIPFGTVSPQESLDPNAVLITMRNFGNVTYYGADIAFSAQVNHHLALGGTYSYISKNFFSKGTSQASDIYLNAPKHKFGLQVRYTNQQLRLITDVRLRWVDAYDMISPFVGSSVRSFFVIDVNIDWRFLFNTRLTLTVQNLLNNEHMEFVGAPRIGRLAIARVTQTF